MAESSSEIKGTISCSEGMDYLERRSTPATSKANLGSNLSNNGYKKRGRRHIYHDIVPVKTRDAEMISYQSPEIVNGHAEREPKFSLVKPEIPPKPKYILRDKNQRHVYQSINLTSDNAQFRPPPLPNKPPRLQKLKPPQRDSSPPLVRDSPPPLPPRVLNEAAIQQRHRLDHEYFENLRKSVDQNLLGLAEATDLPVPLNLPETLNMQSSRSRIQYGAHSPPLTNAGSNENSSPRRHSLPDHELLAPSTYNAPQPERPSTTAFPDLNIGLMKNSCEVNLAKNFRLLKQCGWYWGNMSWQEAEELLSRTDGNGVFLVRDSQDPRHLLTITVRSTTNTLHHIRVEYCEGKFQLYEPGGSVSQSTAQCVRHSNIQQFIHLAVKHSMSGSFLYFLKPRFMGEPPVQIQLLTPTSRLSKIKSLKYACRMVIRKYVVPDLIPRLPVPPSIQQYLGEGPYYDAKEESSERLGV